MKNTVDYGHKPPGKCPPLAGKDNIKMDLGKCFLMDGNGSGLCAMTSFAFSYHGVSQLKLYKCRTCIQFKFEHSYTITSEPQHSWRWTIQFYDKNKCHTQRMVVMRGLNVECETSVVCLRSLLGKPIEGYISN